jgi:hypothetical protein
MAKIWGIIRVLKKYSDKHKKVPHRDLQGTFTYKILFNSVTESDKIHD